VRRDVAILRRKIQVLDGHCHAIRRDPPEIHRTAVAQQFISEDNAYLEQMPKAHRQQPAQIGTVDEIRETIEQYENAGVDELIVPDFTLGAHRKKVDTLDRFIKLVAGR
jgi:alkanesulfonate monooxygenase SsuD/methylene tetrahydromethanopterin reductase-like flavin-dependent oxidoreductase (luciferase family)